MRKPAYSFLKDQWEGFYYYDAYTCTSKQIVDIKQMFSIKEKSFNWNKINEKYVC